MPEQLRDTVVCSARCCHQDRRPAPPRAVPPAPEDAPSACSLRQASSFAGHVLADIRARADGTIHGLASGGEDEITSLVVFVGDALAPPAKRATVEIAVRRSIEASAPPLFEAPTSAIRHCSGGHGTVMPLAWGLCRSQKNVVFDPSPCGTAGCIKRRQGRPCNDH
jgi:hypothetical protein